MEEERKRVAFFLKGDDKFVEDIIEELSIKYKTKKIIVKTQEELKLIDQWMEWADICWFEWCDGLIVYGSKLAIAKERKIICRLHSYEAFTGYPAQVNWSCIDQLVFVAEHIQKFVTENYKVHRENTIVIPNGVDKVKWTYKERKPGFKVAYVGYINYKKGPMLLLHTFKAIYDADSRYQFHVAGQFQDRRDSLYFQQMIEEFGLQNNFFFEGWQEDLDQWLDDKNYILCTSILESQNMSVMQAMAKGIKPVIHNFAGAKGIYKKEYIWNTIDEAVRMIIDKNYDSKEYMGFIEEEYALAKQSEKVNRMMDELISKEKKPEGFNYKDYWNQRLNSRFNIEGVGYLGLGEIYNQFLYRNRIDLLEGVISKAFDGICDKKVLELGPGTGIFTEFFRNKGVLEYSAIDIVEKSAKELKSRYNHYSFRQGDICDSNAYEGMYDLIFAADVLLHITDEDKYANAINNISQHLNEYGLCILLDPISVIHSKSQSAHVVIRDREYVEETLRNCGLEMVDMLPVAYFMNYSFDGEVIGLMGGSALEAFNLIGQLFMDNSICNDEKQLIGEFLSHKDKQLIYQKNHGLSEKLLIIQKAGIKRNYNFSLKVIFNIDNIKENISLIHEKLTQKDILQNSLFNKINKLLEHLEEDDGSSLHNIQKKMNEFISYDRNEFDSYDFSTAQVAIGRREKVEENYELIEFILYNDQNSKLIFNNIWYDIPNEKIILPNSMQESKNRESVLSFVRNILGYKLIFQKNIAAFVNDSKLTEDIRKNSLAYIWERGIPASHYMPMYGYLKIIERYSFAAGFMKKDDKVLEAPCGYGYGAAYFSRMCMQVEALDIAEDNIAFAREAYRHRNINWRYGDVLKLPYEDNEFDMYVSYEVLEHLPIDVAEKCIEEGYRVIKKAGKFIISTPNRETRKHVHNPFHIKEYGFEEFKEMVEKYFNKVEFFSMSKYQVEPGMKETAYDMIAVCEK